jgi:biopolymer transport protein ExbD
MSSSPASPNSTAEARVSGSIDSGEKDVYDDINITPMLDLAYVLMVIFIIMTTASVQGIKVNLPKASDTPSLAKPQTKAITITADGTMYLDTYPVSLTELESALRNARAVNPNLPVVVKADSTIAYQRVVDVLDLLGRLDISQLGLVTQRPK